MDWVPPLDGNLRAVIPARRESTIFETCYEKDWIPLRE